MKSGSAKSQNPVPGTRVLLMLPCFNEARVLSKVLQESGQLGEGFDTLVVDDGSTDETYRVAKAQSLAIRLPVNLGIGGAVHTAIRYAHENDYDFCAQVDGDGQHPPDQVLVLLEAYRGEPVNIVIGSRYLRGEGFRSTLARRTGSSIIGLALRVLFGHRVSDPTSGLRLFDRAAISYFAASYPHDFPEPISLARAFRHGLTMREVPVRMRDREHGLSSITGLKTLAYMIRVLGYILLIWLGQRR